jgi:hypothetical protein
MYPGFKVPWKVFCSMFLDDDGIKRAVISEGDDENAEKASSTLYDFGNLDLSVIICKR